MPQPERDLATTAPMSPTALSYSALALYERCGYRFYAERVLGLPQVPTGAEPTELVEVTRATLRPTPAQAQLGGSDMAGAERGTLIHQLLAGLDVRRPVLDEPMPDDVRTLLLSLIDSSSFRRLAELREIRREQRFAFAHGEVVISGVFDVLAREPEADRLLVIDYKSDRLGGGAPRRSWPSATAPSARSTRWLRSIWATQMSRSCTSSWRHPTSRSAWSARRPTIPRSSASWTNACAGIRSADFHVTESPGRHVCEGCPAEGGLCSHPLELTRR